MTIYASSESHIFLQLLMYRIKPHRFPIFHYLSSYLYLFTRIGTMILFFVCYIEWCINYGDFVVSNDPFDIGWCYTLWYVLCNFVYALRNLKIHKKWNFSILGFFYHHLQILY